MTAPVNLFENPVLAVNSDGWSNFNSTTLRTNEIESFYGGYSWRITSTVDSFSGIMSKVLSGATAGLQRTISCWLYVEPGSPLVGKGFKAIARESGGASGTAESVLDYDFIAGWQRISVPRTIAQNDRTAIQLHVFIPSGEAAPIGSRFYMTAGQVEAGLVATPFNFPVIEHYIPGQANPGPGVDPAVGGVTASLIRYYKAVDVPARDAITNMADGDYCYVESNDMLYVRAAGAWIPLLIAADSITDTMLAPDSVGTSELKIDAVLNENLGADVVTSAEIADNAVGPEHIQADAVGSSEIAALAVGTGELADNAVTAVKLASLKAGIGIGSTSGGSNVLQIVPLTEVYDTDNYLSAGNPTRVTAQAAGIYLIFGYVVSGGTNFQGNYLRKNGSTYFTMFQNPASFCFAWNLSAGDYFEIAALWDSGAFTSSGSLGMIRIG